MAACLTTTGKATQGSEIMIKGTVGALRSIVMAAFTLDILNKARPMVMVFINEKTTIYIWAIGTMDKNKDLVYGEGQMVTITMGIGIIPSLMDKGSMCGNREIGMKGNGWIALKMVWGPSFIVRLEMNTVGILKMGNSKGLGCILIEMGLGLRVFLRMGGRMGKGFLKCKTGTNTSAIFKMT